MAWLCCTMSALCAGKWEDWEQESSGCMPTVLRVDACSLLSWGCWSEYTHTWPFYGARASFQNGGVVLRETPCEKARARWKPYCLFGPSLRSHVAFLPRVLVGEAFIRIYQVRGEGTQTPFLEGYVSTSHCKKSMRDEVYVGVDLFAK